MITGQATVRLVQLVLEYENSSLQKYNFVN